MPKNEILIQKILHAEIKEIKYKDIENIFHRDEIIEESCIKKLEEVISSNKYDQVHRFYHSIYGFNKKILKPSIFDFFKTKKILSSTPQVHYLDSVHSMYPTYTMDGYEDGVKIYECDAMLTFEKITEHSIYKLNKEDFIRIDEAISFGCNMDDINIAFIRNIKDIPQEIFDKYKTPIYYLFYNFGYHKGFELPSNKKESK
jgi:hypothetical protein